MVNHLTVTSFAKFFGLSGLYPSAMVVSYANFCSGMIQISADSASPDLGM